ncbi:hypothetical protein BpHYR1_028454 [Brachionus plicatilis]|uniref:Uncharacterized protein n=1 Tax=Brachionus plicatilis TaxID=10195 RepID=A0A3M7RFU5_BRAPC|nr:hypothetical protein BpHYR1_028454 [Brachionus plicatilis]
MKFYLKKQNRIKSIKTQSIIQVYLSYNEIKYEEKKERERKLSISISVKELINLEKKKANVNSPKELNTKLPGVTGFKDDLCLIFFKNRLPFY